MKYIFKDSCIGVSIFRQAGASPTITLVSVGDITDSTANVNVSIADGEDVSKTGVEIDTDPLFSNPTQYEENGAVNTIAVDNLNAETTYYVRAYVIWNGQTIYSANTLNFITESGSILPAELQACEYLETDGACWIKTDYQNKYYGQRLLLKFSVVNDANNNSLLFGARAAGGNNQLVIYPSPMYSEFRMWNGTGTNSSYSIHFDFSSNQDFVASINGINWNIYDFNGNLLLSHSFNSLPNSSQYLYLFQTALPNIVNTSASFAGTKIYYFEIENICKYIACYVKSGKTFIDNKGNVCSAGTFGMYDIVNQVFYTNDGTGTFSHGADINI